MKLLDNTHARIAASNDTYPLYMIATDDCSKSYNIPCLSKYTIESAISQLYNRTSMRYRIQQLPVILPYFETYDDLLQNYPELLI